MCVCVDWYVERGDRAMDAYYYGFDRTGVEAVDRILAAVARAGKAYHYTGPETWTEPCETCGKSCADAIQEAADNAARALQSVPSDPKEK